MSIPEAYAHNPMMRSRHWVNDMTQVSGFVGPAFILVWAPDLWWNRQAIPKALRLRPGVNNPEAQFMVCPHGCGGHLIVKGSWVARTVMGFGEDGAIVAKQMACSTCNRRVMPWDPLLLETLPRHVQDDFPIVMYKKFALLKKLQTFVLNGAAARMSFNSISRRLNEVRCTSELVNTKQYYSAHITVRKYAAATSQTTLYGGLNGMIPELPKSALVSGSGHQLASCLPREKMMVAGARSMCSIKGDTLAGDDHYKTEI